ncbi:DUF359 domain-containing protein [Halogeometricum borinquense]|uniref:GTP-dependent dephospho-CoA kinase n=1 Tax=Halogeometricum borinquense TaxID=60847 RepID=A0A6C0USI4_9EURY|nr:GTP-dependent dephospho-CoA kinase family protein [Halogeometricum borinquense]QIB75918.1 DUF359 domain-containing protein [Halogeometricum borinquense]QIQ75500.1 DUF359 domain-containing protein [Halogeometricum borinquense]
MLRLPTALRGEFKEPFGPLYTDADRLLADAGCPIVAVGDVVTHHLRRAGRTPDVAVIDGKTKREAVDEEIRRALSDPETRRDVSNPAGEITEALADTIRDALAADDPVTVVVAGEEDLATLPAVVAAPTGGSVVYGQPDEGMVLIDVTDDSKAEMRSLLRRMDGDAESLLSLLES